MNRLRKQTHWIALIALVVLLGACKGESPTAPPAGGGGGGGLTPPTGAAITVTASTTDLEVDQTTVISASVTINGQAAPNGTAVEFVTTRGTFADSGTTSTIRTTTNGVATASLSSATAGTAVVSVTVTNITRQSPTITFRARPVTQPQPNTDPSVSSITPSFGLPTGGEQIRITGTNFRGKVKVLFDIPGEAFPRELFVTSQTETEIIAFTPNVQLTPGQELSVPVRVVVDADTVNQKTASAPSPFVFRTIVLTPSITTASPNSGPITGGTRVTLFGNNFQAPVQVLFGAAEARVIGDIRFDSIVVETPPAHEALGGLATTGAVDITVLNINSAQRNSLSGGFRYTPSMAITGITPFNGPALGGTDITVSGLGLDGRLQATVASVEAQIIRTSGTSILLRTAPASSPCANTSGPVIITNLDTGLSASSDPLSFTYIGIPARITAVSGPVAPGGNVTVTVTNPGIGVLGFGDIKFTVNGVSTIPSPAQITTGTGSQTFTVAVPSSGFTFPSQTCTTTGGLAGTQLAPVDASLVFTNITTGCTADGSVRVNPPAPNTCLTGPRPSVTQPPGGSCATPGQASVTGTIDPLTTQSTITISNAADSQPLNITAVSISGSNAAEFSIAPTSASNIAAGGSQNFTLTFDPSTAGPKSATVTFTTNSTTTPTLTVCVSANGTP